MITSKSIRYAESLLKKVNLLELTCVGLSAAVVELAIDGVLLRALATVAISLFVAYGAIATQTSWLKDVKFSKFIRKNGVIPVIGISVVTGLCLYFLLSPETASAQFFFNAETKIKTGLATFSGDGATENTAFLTNIITMVFWLFRFLMVIYLAVQIIKIIGQMREEEDWKATAKTPVMFLILITVGDQVSKMILGA